MTTSVIAFLCFVVLFATSCQAKEGRPRVTIGPAVPGRGGTCDDVIQACAGLQASGACATFASYMSVNCRRTCGLCPGRRPTAAPGTTHVTIDTPIITSLTTRLPQGSGATKMSKEETSMVTTLASITTAQRKCKDRNPVCYQLAAAGRCTGDPLMPSICPDSCGLCTTTTTTKTISTLRSTSTPSSTTTVPSTSTASSTTTIPSTSTVPSSNSTPIISTAPSTTTTPITSTAPSTTTTPSTSTATSTTTTPSTSTVLSSNSTPSTSTAPSTTNIHSTSTASGTNTTRSTSTTPSTTTTPSKFTAQSTTTAPSTTTTQNTITTPNTATKHNTKASATSTLTGNVSSLLSTVESTLIVRTSVGVPRLSTSPSTKATATHIHQTTFKAPTAKTTIISVAPTQLTETAYTKESTSAIAPTNKAMYLKTTSVDEKLNATVPKSLEGTRSTSKRTKPHTPATVSTLPPTSESHKNIETTSLEIPIKTTDFQRPTKPFLTFTSTPKATSTSEASTKPSRPTPPQSSSVTAKTSTPTTAASTIASFTAGWIFSAQPVRTTTPNGCVDLHPNCGPLRRRGYCRNTPLQMNAICAKTCGHC